MADVTIAITGAGGRMGRQLIQAVRQTPGVRLVAAFARAGSPFIGVDAGQLAGIGQLNVRISDDLRAAADDFELLIDFTRPEGSLAHLAFCRQQGKNMVIGTTGFDESGKAAISAAAADIAIVFAANFSPGINAVLKLLEKAATMMGHYTDIEIIEKHHRHKIDAPSGTAMAMGEVIASTLKRDLKQCAVYARADLNSGRVADSIGFASVRAGDIVGEHTVLFAGGDEQIEITHKASGRMAFVQGAVRAALWLSGQKRGLFGMSDVLDMDSDALVMVK